MLVDIVIDVTQKKIDCRIHWSVMIKLETYFIKIFCSFYILYNTWYHIFVILLTWASVEMWVCSYCQAVTSWIWWRSEVFLQGDDHLLPGVVCLWTSWTWTGLSDWFFACGFCLLWWVFMFMACHLCRCNIWLETFVSTHQHRDKTLLSQPQLRHQL